MDSERYIVLMADPVPVMPVDDRIVPDDNRIDAAVFKKAAF